MHEWGRGEGGSRCLTRPLILSLCGVVGERLLPCRIVDGSMGCIMYTDYVNPAFVPLLADISCLLFLFRKFFVVVVVPPFFFSFPPYVLSFLLAISYPLVSLPD